MSYHVLAACVSDWQHLEQVGRGQQILNIRFLNRDFGRVSVVEEKFEDIRMNAVYGDCVLASLAERGSEHCLSKDRYVKIESDVNFSNVLTLK